MRIEFFVGALLAPLESVTAEATVTALDLRDLVTVSHLSDMLRGDIVLKIRSERKTNEDLKCSAGRLRWEMGEELVDPGSF